MRGDKARGPLVAVAAVVLAIVAGRGVVRVQAQDMQQQSAAVVQDSMAGGLDHGLEGRLKINGDLYSVTCDCSKDALANAAKKLSAVKAAVKCKKPSRYLIFKDKSNPEASVAAGSAGAMMTPQEVTDFLGVPRDLEYVDINKRTLDVMDGREDSKSIVGTLGGEIGEFVLALTAYRNQLGITKLLDADVKRYMEAFLNHTSAMGRHIDFSWAQNIENLKTSIGVRDDELSFDSLSATPQVSMIKKILGLECPTAGEPCGLDVAASIGMPYLRRMLSSATDSGVAGRRNGYGVPADIIQMVVKELWKMFWDFDGKDIGSNYVAPNLRQVIYPPRALKGQPGEEKAFVLITSSSGCRERQLAPKILPKKDGKEIFVLHPDASSVREKELCQLFERIDTSGHIKADTMCDEVARLQKLHLTLTGQEMHRLGIPSYMVQVA